MNEDMFDVVNERDEVVGQERRSVVHARGLRHRAVHILIFNAMGELFLQKRSMNKDVAPGCWDSSCCGHVDSGETYQIAAARELDEELSLKNVDPQQLDLLFKVEACVETGQEFVHVYRLEQEGPFELHPEEIDEGRWFTISEVNRLVAEESEDFAASFRHIWKQFKTVR
jgi:isopentenyl-diphosphate delta-isomerase type 1